MTRTKLSQVFVSGIFAASLAIATSPAQAKYEDSPLKPIQEMVNDGKFDKAVNELEAMLKKNGNDADVLSLLGYSYRKQQQYDKAQEYYGRALKIDPEHKAANEYLGQLYLEIGQLDKAKERLAVLDEACFFTCSEYTTLKTAIDKYQQ